MRDNDRIWSVLFPYFFRIIGLPEHKNELVDTILVISVFSRHFFDDLIQKQTKISCSKKKQTYCLCCRTKLRFEIYYLLNQTASKNEAKRE